MDSNINQRLGTRVRAQIPLRLRSLEPGISLAESCYTLLVNPKGCGVRLKRPLQPGLRIKIDQLPGGGSTTARVACSLPPVEGCNFWIIGIGLDSPGNLWCLAPTPSDWGPYASAPKFFPIPGIA